MATPIAANPQQQALIQLALTHPELAAALMAKAGIAPPPVGPAGPGASMAAATTPGGMTGAPIPPVANAGPTPPAGPLAGLEGLSGAVAPSMPADASPPPPPGASVQGGAQFQSLGIAALLKQLLMGQQQAQPMSLGAAISGGGR